MRVVFMGTPHFAVPALEAVVGSGHAVPLVVTRPDRPRGRGLALEPSPVKQAAERLGLPVYQPEKPNSPESLERVREARPDCLVVVAYGAILKEGLLTVAPKGAINVHASLLPRHRGAAPIEEAIRSGDTVTGITTMHMDRGLDTGDIILAEPIPIGPDETGGGLHDRLAVLGGRVLADTLARLEAGTAPRTPQQGEATYAARLTREDGQVDWRQPVARLYDRVRAMTPRPGATAFFRGQSILLLETRRADVAARGDSPAPGAVIGLFGEAVRIAADGGALDLLRVRPAGKPAMTGAAWARGRRLNPGDLFDPPPARDTAEAGPEAGRPATKGGAS